MFQLSEDLEAKQNDVTAMEQRRDHLKDSLESAQNIAEETEKDIDEKKKLLRDSELNIERIRRLNNEHKVQVLVKLQKKLNHTKNMKKVPFG